MVKKIKGDLILKEDTKFEESIEVEGNITSEGERRNLTVVGNIDARDIDAGNIDARDIDARDIDAGNIDAWDIDAGNIDAGNIDARDIDAWDIDAGNIDARNIIFCEKVNRAKLKAKIKCKVLIENRLKLIQKEFE